MLKLEWISWVILRRTWWVRLLSPKPHIDQPLDAYCRQRGCDLEQGHSVQLKSISTEAWEWRALCWQHLPQLGLSANQSNRGFSVVDQSIQYAVFPGPTKTLELSFVSLLTFYPSDLQSTTSATAELHTTIASTLDGLSSILTDRPVSAFALLLVYVQCNRWCDHFKPCQVASLVCTKL